MFSSEETKDLVETITVLADLGFGMTKRDIGELVHSFVEHNNHVRGKKTFSCRGIKGYPGPDWVNKFIINENLSVKKVTTLSTSRYNATKNPFIIKHFYDLLEKSVSDLGLHERPDLIWNCDESGLPHEPSKLTIISRKGQKTLLVRNFFYIYF